MTFGKIIRKSTGFVFSKKLNCWLRSKKLRYVNDVEIQQKIVDRDIKVVLVGAGTVGKTSLLSRYFSDQFTHSTPVLFDNGQNLARIRFNGKDVGIGLHDTAGSEDLDGLSALKYPETDTFVLCFDSTNHTSLKNIVHFYEEVMMYSPQAGIVVCSTKIDLRSDPEIMKKHEEESKYGGKRILRTLDGLEVAKKIGAEVYVETSSRTSFNCQCYDKSKISENSSASKSKKKRKEVIGFEKAMIIAFVMKQLDTNFSESDGGKCCVM